MFLQKLIEFLYTWEFRLGVILSMSIQITLVIFGSRRKILAATWLNILVWCAYMSADVVAAFSLGGLAQNRGESYNRESLQNHQLRLLWVPFLILHLGGPDTITAYSLEDNNLWLRHLLNLVIQVGVAFYAVIKFWNSQNPLTYLVIPIFVSGVFKYCERIWALKSASLEQLYECFHRVWPTLTPRTGNHIGDVNVILSQLTLLVAGNLSKRNGEVFDILSSNRYEISRVAFKLVEDELGLMYDLLYTKALLIYSRCGICILCVCLVSSIATLTSFVIVHKHNEAVWSEYPSSDVLITYFLMIGAVILEIYAIVLVVLSDWTLLWLDRSSYEFDRFACRRRLGFATFLFPKINACSIALFGEKRWSRSIKQYCILKHWVLPKKLDSGKGKLIQNIFPFNLLWGHINVDTISYIREIDEMKEVVLKVIEYKSYRYHTEFRQDIVHKKPSQYLSERGDEVLEKYGYLRELRWSTTENGFDQSLFIWHSATSLCYYSEYEITGSSGDDNVNVGSNAKTSKCLSDYFMYLARFRHKLLPPGNYKDICSGVSDIFLRYFDKLDGSNCDRILKVASESWVYLQGRSLTLMLRDQTERPAYIGVRLALFLSGIEEGKRWKIISEVWAHMLLYAAATQHVWEQHAQHLRRGGEFITHVAVLMALLDLTDQLDKVSRAERNK